MARNILRKVFKWIFKEEVAELERTKNGWQFALNRCLEKEKKLDNILGNIDVSVDVHHHSPSWAVISIQGERSDYIKFVDLGKSEIKDIKNFLMNFDRTKIDASPGESKFLKIKRY
jgi:hypothetical protein